MWIATPDGFFSVVRDHFDHGKVLVRARSRDDLKALAARLRCEPPIISTPEADYPWRFRLKRRLWKRYLDRAADAIQYGNFKAEIAARAPERERIYSRVWAILWAIEREKDPPRPDCRDAEGYEGDVPF